MDDFFILKIFRGEKNAQYFEEFKLKKRPFLNVISALMEIQKNPINIQGKKVTPIAWEQGCLEEVCGSCSMLINGKPRQSCTALIDDMIKQSGTNTVTLAPMTKFPLVKDLVVDRENMFSNLKKIQAWIDTDDSQGRDYYRPMAPDVAETRYVLSTCMTCGVCSEGCPQVSEKSSFVGPAAVSQVRLFNAHPIGTMNRKQRLSVMLEEEGIAACGNAQNCVQVCPKKIPLTESIAVIGRQATVQAWKNMIHVADS
jgi:succinate dehydrogenase / fumarate reductase, iron-sulfur subunit